MAPRSQIILVASVLFAASASAQLGGGVPPACQAVIDLSTSCSSSTDPGCLCDDPNFEANFRECASATGAVPEFEQALDQIRELCDSLGGGGGGSNPTPTGGDDEPTSTAAGDDDEPTSTPEPSGGLAGANACSSIADGFTSCVTDLTEITEAPVVSCLCEAPGFDDNVAACYTYASDLGVTGVESIASFSGYCSLNGADSPATSTGRGATPTSESGPEETDADSEETSGGVTSRPTGTDSVGGAGQGTTSAPSATSRSAGSIVKTTFAGSAITALFVAVAMFL